MANTNFFARNYFYNNNKNEISLMPFKFDRWTDKVFISNDIGENIFLTNFEFELFVSKSLDRNTEVYKTLKSKGFLVDNNSSSNIDLLASRYRTKKSFIEGFSKLHIFVTSLRCNLSCPYCQVSRQNITAQQSVYDMSNDVLDKSIDLMLKNPSPQVTMEFQGGEPLTSFELIKRSILTTKEKNEKFNKEIDFVICTNLSFLEDSHLDFFKEHRVNISTSLDGPKFLHNKNRPNLKGEATYDLVVENIRRCQDALGVQHVSALMTTTRESLKYPKEIIDEYINLDLSSMFIRELNPYGFALKSKKSLGYTTEEFVSFYKKALDHIIDINLGGGSFSEAYAATILSKIYTPWPVGFVDLQSPTGSGFSVTLYNYDGDVYASDESRMLAEIDDYTFRLGNVIEDTYEDIFLGDTMQMLASASCNESLPGCSDCAYQSYCGADPVRNHATQNDIVGNRGEGNGFCKKNMSIIKYLINLYNNADDDVNRILWSWINRDDHRRMKLGS